ncbi:MAG TPA: hypothetical protein VEX12_05955 [Microbacterium sp.]|nr:hypothetical protein [Microbacterium sp.]
MPRPPESLADPVENVLQRVADCQPYETALSVWESALRKELTTATVLSRFPLAAGARRILADAQPFSDSGLETVVVP